MDKDISTVCAISSEFQEKGKPFSGSGQGVFMTPRRVLTAWHVLEGTKSLKFANALNWETTMKPKSEGGQHFFNRELDVALVELRHPIGHNLALPPRGIPPMRGSFTNAAILKTRFGGKPAVHPLEYDFTETMGHRNDRDRMTFRASFESRPGYSGSPVFEKDGMTLLSLLTGIYESEVQRAHEYRHVFAAAKVNTGTAAYIPFLGIHPQSLASWYAKISQKLTL